MMARRALGTLLALAVGAAGFAGGAPASDQGVIAGRVVASPLAVRLILARERIAIGECTTATALVDNLARNIARDFAVALAASRTGLAAPAGWSRGLGAIPAGKQARVVFVLCGRVAGNYVVVASAAVRISGHAFAAESDAPLLRVEARRR